LLAEHVRQVAGRLWAVQRIATRLSLCRLLHVSVAPWKKCPWGSTDPCKCLLPPPCEKKG